MTIILRTFSIFHPDRVIKSEALLTLWQTTQSKRHRLKNAMQYQLFDRYFPEFKEILSEQCKNQIHIVLFLKAHHSKFSLMVPTIVFVL